MHMSKHGLTLDQTSFHYIDIRSGKLHYVKLANLGHGVNGCRYLV